jgi:hypothetical protein
LIPNDKKLEWHPTQAALAQIAIRFIKEPDWALALAAELEASAN